MSKAVKKYGGSKFKVPPGGHFIKIDRFTGAQLPDNASGPNVIAEYFRDGVEPLFGIMYDGGFAMGENLPLYTPADAGVIAEVVSSSGRKAQITGKADSGAISAGGLY